MQLLFPILLTLLAFGLHGCASYPHNPKLDRYDLDKGYRYDELSDQKNSESLFVILTFSGGGTRAAALSYGVLEKLRNTPIVWEGKHSTLLDEVDVISSVSGGSFTAGYYAAFGDATFKDKSQSGFLRDFLYRDIEGELFNQLFNPANWFRLASPDYSRIDMAANLYNEEIFKGVKYADLVIRKTKPYLMVNATDMSLGSRFTFEQAQFDPMCSDLGGVDLARAVAASSNFPVAFPPMTMDNHAGSCGYSEHQPGWIAEAEKDLPINPSRYKNAVLFKTYQDGKKRPFIHLLDGGIADNLGLRGPLQALASNDSELNLPVKMGAGVIKKLLIITVDAKNKPNLNYDSSASPPSVIDVLKIVANVPMDNFSFETTETLRKTFTELEKDKNTYLACQSQLQQHCPAAVLSTPAPKIPELGFIYIGFDLLSDAAERDKFFNMKTSFSLPEEQIDELRDVAKRLLDKSETYRKFVKTTQ
ncbi:MAG: patatin-like phospholipase family protein [Methylococcales bacterium]|nr:patatin-like phospholipase family protein [Methylococcales bacterium]